MRNYSNCYMTTFNIGVHQNYRFVLLPYVNMGGGRGERLCFGHVISPSGLDMYPHEDCKVSVDDTRNYKYETLCRARRQILNIARNNFSDRMKFLTLTYATPTLEKSKIRADLKVMCKRFYRDYNYNLKYIAVLETHKNYNSYHIHMIIDSHYIKQDIWQNNIWKNGIINIQKIKSNENKKSIIQVISYVSKYVSKALSSNESYVHNYLVSKNWNRQYIKSSYIYTNTPQHLETELNKIYNNSKTVSSYMIQLPSDEVGYVYDVY